VTNVTQLDAVDENIFFPSDFTFLCFAFSRGKKSCYMVSHSAIFGALLHHLTFSVCQSVAQTHSKVLDLKPILYSFLSCYIRHFLFLLFFFLKGNKLVDLST